MSNINSLERFGDAATVFADWYDRLAEKSDLLFVENDGRAKKSAALVEGRGNLLAGRFIVAVCGQMNAGKSTLLNALIFGRPVLPEAPTTMTAKIALLQGADREQVVATLYTRGEFDSVIRASSKDLTAAEELRRARQLAGDAGLNEAELLVNPARKEIRDSLASLGEFLAVPTKGGTYTPYVRDVTVDTKAPWLEQVQVADTPGTDDPNPERDRITKEWISKADAVIYVTYAGQAGMSGTDVAFIDEHLRHLPPRKRIIAVNKCDTQDDLTAVESHLINLAEGKDLRMRELFRDRDQVVLVSGLAGLIDVMRQGDEPLPERLNDELDYLGRTGWLDPERHGLHRLREVVEGRLMADRGWGLLQAHAGRLRSTVGAAVDEYHARKEEAMAAHNLALASSSDRAKECERVGASIDQIHSLFKSYRGNIERERRGAFSDEKKTESEIVESFGEWIKAELQGITTIRGLQDQALWALPRALDMQGAAIARCIDGKALNIERVLDGAANDLSDQLLQSELGRIPSFRTVLSTDARRVVAHAREDAESAMDASALRTTVNECTNFIQRLFDTSGGVTAVKEVLIPKLVAKSGALLVAIFEKVNARLDEATEEAMEGMQASINETLERQYQRSSKLEAQGVDSEAEARESASKAQQWGVKMAETEALKAELEQDLSALGLAL